MAAIAVTLTEHGDRAHASLETSGASRFIKGTKHPLPHQGTAATYVPLKHVAAEISDHVSASLDVL